MAKRSKTTVQKGQGQQKGTVRGQRGRRAGDSTRGEVAYGGSTRRGRRGKHSSLFEGSKYSAAIDEYRAQQMPVGHQAVGFFGSGQEVPFERTPARVGKGYAVGSGQGVKVEG